MEVEGCFATAVMLIISYCCCAAQTNCVPYGVSLSLSLFPSHLFSLHLASWSGVGEKRERRAQSSAQQQLPSVTGTI